MPSVSGEDHEDVELVAAAADEDVELAALDEEGEVKVADDGRTLDVCAEALAPLSTKPP